MSKGLENGSYCHELFMRGRGGLCPGILRLKRRPDFHWKDEPNFYSFDPLDDIAAVACKSLAEKKDENKLSEKSDVTKKQPLQNAVCLNSSSIKIVRKKGKEVLSQDQGEKLDQNTSTHRKLHSSTANDSNKALEKIQKSNKPSDRKIMLKDQSAASSLKRDKAQIFNHEKVVSSDVGNGDSVALNEMVSAPKSDHTAPCTCPLRKLSEIIDAYT